MYLPFKQPSQNFVYDFTSESISSIVNITMTYEYCTLHWSKWNNLKHIDGFTYFKLGAVISSPALTTASSAQTRSRPQLSRLQTSWFKGEFVGGIFVESNFVGSKLAGVRWPAFFKTTCVCKNVVLVGLKLIIITHTHTSVYSPAIGDLLLSLFCLYSNFLATAPIGFVHDFQLGTFFQPGTLLSSFVIISPRFECTYTCTCTHNHTTLTYLLLFKLV